MRKKARKRNKRERRGINIERNEGRITQIMGGILRGSKPGVKIPGK